MFIFRDGIKMPVLLILIFIYFSTSPGILEAFPTEFSGYSENRMQGSDYAAEATSTEMANSTGIMSSVWRKISNIFKSGSTTEFDIPDTTMPFDPEMKQEGSSRFMRMIPADFGLQEEDKMAQKEAFLNRGFYPAHPHRLRMRRSDSDMFLQANEEQSAEVRNKASTKHDALFTFTKKHPSNMVADKKVPIIHEEFDQGQIDGINPKRFKDIQKFADWKTEKIVVDSDPVEDIDNTNYIEETKSSNFPFHSFPVKPILVEDNFSFEISTSSEKELPPLKIVEY